MSSYSPIAPQEQKTTRPTPETRTAARSKRTFGEDAVPAPGHSTKNLPRDFRQINGWGADLDPKNFTVRTVPALLAKTKAWQGYDDAAASIKSAMKKLTGKI